MRGTSWTDEQRDGMARMWKDGSTASEIAERYGCTRNAVTGLLHRMGLLGIQRKRAPLTEKRISPAHTGGLAFSIINRLSAPPVAPVDQPPMKVADVTPLNLSLMQLVPGVCRYPYGGEDGVPITFCGHDSIEGQSYCPSHAALCWREPQQRIQPKRGRV